MEYEIVPVMTQDGKKLAAIRNIGLLDADQLVGMDPVCEDQVCSWEVLAIGSTEEDLRSRFLHRRNAKPDADN